MSKSEENIYFDFTLKPGQKREKECIKEKIVPKINIITIYSNCNNEIDKTLNSLINQTFQYWEWDIINTCDTSKKLVELSQKDIRINIHSINKENIKDKIQEFDCDLIFMLKEGDVLDKTSLECAYWSLITNPEASWCYSNYVVNGESLENVLFSSDEEKLRNIVSSSYLIKKTDLLQVKEFILDDWLLFLKLLEKNKFPVKMDFYANWSTKRDIKIEQEKINQQILNIKNKIIGINYPVGCNYWFNASPFELQWNEEMLKKDEKQNLLFIFPWFRVGGADKFNYDLISNLDREKYNITIITTEPCPYIWRQKFEKYAEIFDLTSFLTRENWAAFVHYIIKTRNIKLVMNSNSFYGYYVIPWLKSKFPEVIFTDYLHAVNWNWRHGEYPTDSTAISRLLDKTFVSSNQVKEAMENNMGRKIDNTEVLYIGVDDEKFKENNPEIIPNPELIKNQDKYKNKKVILFCSRISPEKRPILMLKILEELKKQRNDIVLFVVGDGTELQHMKEKAEQLNLKENIIFFGMQNEVRPFYKIADALVICSIREGITLTTYEALAMSTPVITADVGGQSELVNNSCGRVVQNIQEIQDGETCTEYDTEEIKRYANAILEILDSPEYEQIKKNCRAIIEEKFSLSKMCEKMNNEFEILIQQGTKIPKELIKNEELYKQYLLLYNEVDKRFYNSTKGEIILEEELIKEHEEKNKKEEAKQEKQKLRKQLNEYATQITQKEEEILEKNEQIENLREEISKIYNSKRWKYLNNVIKFFRK